MVDIINKNINNPNLPFSVEKLNPYYFGTDISDGFVLRIYDEKDRVYIDELYLPSEIRNKNIGKKILDIIKIISKKPIEAEVEEFSKQEKFFKREGFVLKTSNIGKSLQGDNINLLQYKNSNIQGYNQESKNCIGL